MVENVGIFTLLDEVMLSGVYILIVAGAVVMLISFLGCYGGFNESKPAIVVVRPDSNDGIKAFRDIASSFKFYSC